LPGAVGGDRHDAGRSAGDTSVGYLAGALARDLALREALEEANAAAALSVTREGAQPATPTRQQVARFLRTLI